MRLFHGGVPGLKVGDVIEPGHERLSHDGCPWCEARAKGEAHQGVDGPSKRPDRVYATTNRLYAKHAILDRAVLLTWSERRRLYREWGAADKEATR